MYEVGVARDSLMVPAGIAFFLLFPFIFIWAAFGLLTSIDIIIISSLLILAWLSSIFSELSSGPLNPHVRADLLPGSKKIASRSLLPSKSDPYFRHSLFHHKVDGYYFVSFNRLLCSSAAPRSFPTSRPTPSTATGPIWNPTSPLRSSLVLLTDRLQLQTIFSLHLLFNGVWAQVGPDGPPGSLFLWTLGIPTIPIMHNL